MNGFAFSLITVSSLALAAQGPVPRQTEESRALDIALATAGLIPFTPETNNRSLEEFRRLLHPLKADLVITKVVLDPAQPKVGDLIGATIYYKNIGGKPAEQFYLHQEPDTLGKGGFGLGETMLDCAGGREAVFVGGDPGDESWGTYADVYH